MPSVLLFCIAEEAKPFVYQAMNTKVPGSDNGYFLLAETHTAPGYDDNQRPRQKLEKDEPFEAEFIGASKQDCQTWAMENQYRVNYIEGDQLVILDTRSAKDGTVLFQHYVHAPGSVLGEMGELGIFPKEADRWYDFRMDIRHVTEFSPLIQDQEWWPVYYGLKEELTNADGIFDVEKAGRICDNEEPGYKDII
ncbi:hypothetical protein F4818DRAFT_226722 [Hypoxylon cercidicola]|nr:hypothetical protein F4818DRAFT_226722 [Hypoxylon cercidicola]